jgi:hypothetical protein
VVPTSFVRILWNAEYTVTLTSRQHDLSNKDQQDALFFLYWHIGFTCWALKEKFILLVSTKEEYHEAQSIECEIHQRPTSKTSIPI